MSNDAVVGLFSGCEEGDNTNQIIQRINVKQRYMYTLSNLLLCLSITSLAISPGLGTVRVWWLVFPLLAALITFIAVSEPKRPNWAETAAWCSVCIWVHPVNIAVMIRFIVESVAGWITLNNLTLRDNYSPAYYQQEALVYQKVIVVSTVFAFLSLWIAWRMCVYMRDIRRLQPRARNEEESKKEK